MTTSTLREPIHILLVDDHQSFLDGLKMLINANKSSMQVVSTANSREEALKAAAEHKPDLILLDIDLGNDNGLEVLPELIEKTGAKVIMLTGVIDQKIHEKAIIGGARGVLLKNSTGQVILKAIEKVYNGEIWANSDTLSRVFDQLKYQKTGGKSDDPEQQKINSLTGREREIISLIVTEDSSTNKEIASRLFISESTLKNHLTTIYSKLGVKNRIDLLKYALTHKLDKS
ncbi:MAG TPA: response regulator transcription factor [Pyrinomonadaceae bacterium]|nr:response regulator transcription factor [Pyrinomonadaceae bacterium]